MANAKGIELEITCQDGAGYATCGDTGVTGKPVWAVHFDNFSVSKWDAEAGHGELHDFQIECGLADLADLLSERFGFSVTVD